jgi:predicted acetyltransferase
MGSVVVRPMRTSDIDGYLAVRSLTYNDGLPVPEERRSEINVDENERFVAAAGAEIEGIFVVLPMTATRGEAVLGCGGVAGVAVSPNSRRGGIGLTMMKWLPGHLRTQGVPLASLYPFRETFYAKAGYEVVGKRFRITVPMHRLPKLNSELPIRRLGPSEWEQLAPCYEVFAKRRSGAHIRSEKMWDRVLNEVKALAIYAAGDPVEAYVAVSHQTAFWVDQWLSEFVWSSERGYQAGIAVMHQLGINKSAVSWFEPSDSPYYAMYLDQGVEVKLDRPVMFRVCDVKGALELLRPHGEGEVTLQVDDPNVPENSTPFKVTWSGRKVAVEVSSSAEIELPIGRFTQVFMGDPSAADLARNGLLRAKTDQALEQLAELLPASPVYCGDFF